MSEDQGGEKTGPAGTSRSVAALIALLVLVSVAAIVVSVVALHDDHRDRTRIHQLEARVRKLTASARGVVAAEDRVSGLERRLAGLEAKLTARAKKQAKAEASLGHLVSCVPELQTEIGALGAKGKSKASAVHVSKACSSVLAPAPSKAK